MSGLTVVKIGGVALSSQDTTFEDIVSLQRQGLRQVIVHGGANRVSGWLERQGTPTRFVRGERVTDLTALEMVTAVLAGLVNKEIVATINCKGGRAVGISGVDGALLQASVREEEMGFVGQLEAVEPAILFSLLEAGYLPVVAPLSLHLVGRQGDAPRLLNVNGDTAAGEISAAIGAEKLIFLTDVAGILDQSGRLLEALTPEDAEALIAAGVASKGMIPKIKAGIRALSSRGTARIIDGRKPHALILEMEGRLEGTTIRFPGGKLEK